MFRKTDRLARKLIITYAQISSEHGDAMASKAKKHVILIAESLDWLQIGMAASSLNVKYIARKVNTLLYIIEIV